MLKVLEQQVIVQSNASLSSEEAVRLLTVLAMITLVVGLGFLRIGAWLVMPFAGLELMAFVYAFYLMRMHANDYESITFENDRVVVGSCVRQKVVETVFNRYWTQVSVRDLTDGRRALFIGSHGREVEFGKNFINDEQRIDLMRELKRKLKNIN